MLSLGKIIKKVLDEYNSYSFPEKAFIIFMMICSFAITAEAAITKAIAQSVFLSAYSSKFFPYAWLSSLPVNFAIVVFYNRFLPTLGCKKMLALTIFTASCINLYCAFFLGQFSFLPFLLYLWKDVFIILVYQQLWSVIHATVNISRAKYLYGIFFGMGGLGSALGSMITGLFAVRVGSEKLLLATLPFYAIVTLFYFWALYKRDKIPTRQNISVMSSDSTDILGGMKLIRGSRFLIFILLIVMGMQVSATILDYQFSSAAEKIYSDQDLRTQFLGRFFGAVNLINVFLQFFGSFLLVQWIGLQGAHFLVPLILGANAIGFLVFPHFNMMCLSFGSIKALDYSLFGIIKEMLYIPLKVDEKFKAKAIIDVFAYRSSKACASFLILLLQFIGLSYFLSWGLVLIFMIWMLAVVLMFKHYHKEVGRQHINWPESKAELPSLGDN